MAEEIAKNSHYRCQYCQVFCKEWYEIINIDGNYDNNYHNNLACACKLCANCLLMDQYTLSYIGESKLIFLPEISQADLNLVVVTMAKIVSSEENKEYTLAAKTLYSSLSGRSDFLKEICQADLSHPSSFLFMSSDKEIDYKLISGVRLIFSFNYLESVCCS
ncbi:hypothetical protein [Piscirickettsia litoralis]|uniref:hypothetical protein n=1 Tax=Piscirickettsia litoralis TaxID=1891921 RepID=UPI001F3C8785|nr:hypothetical protein [Piscirickettsia litoralis]